MDPDLVEYFVVAAPDLDSLGSVAAAIAELVEAETIQILDVVAVVKSSDSDIERTAVVLEPGTAAIIARAPLGPYTKDLGAVALVADQVEQLKELADLYRLGLLSKQELASQRAKVLK